MHAAVDPLGHGQQVALVALVVAEDLEWAGKVGALDLEGRVALSDRDALSLTHETFPCDLAVHHQTDSEHLREGGCDGTDGCSVR
ncbi:MAG: hypothetical protein EBU88_15465 [Acidobacteria bacterium]|nr:hypothetical protein [Acidobacteriota bacterium]